MSLEHFLQKFYKDDRVTVNLQPVQGGDILQSAILNLTDNPLVPEKLFMKANVLSAGNVLKSEYYSLGAINDIFADIYPKPILFDRVGDQAILLMDYYDISPLNQMFAKRAGSVLAQQHRVSQDNYEGHI